MCYPYSSCIHCITISISRKKEGNNCRTILEKKGVIYDERKMKIYIISYNIT